MPMPRTHFLVGIVITQMLEFFGMTVTFWDLMFGGLIASLIDLDHVIVYWRRHRNFDFMKSWYNAIKGLETSQRSWIHEWNGLMFFLFISVIIAYFNKHYAIIFLAAATSHLVLDHEKFHAFHRKYIGFGHFIYPVSREEINLDLFFMAIIILLSLV